MEKAANTGGYIAVTPAGWAQGSQRGAHSPRSRPRPEGLELNGLGELRRRREVSRLPVCHV